MENLSQHFSTICGELCNLLYIEELNRAAVNSLIDELNASAYKAELCVSKNDATALLTALCLNIKPTDNVLSAKSSHLIKSVVTKHNLLFEPDYLEKIILWHIQCLRKCSDVILMDILHSMQCILQISPHSGYKFAEDLIGAQGILINLIDKENHALPTEYSFQISIIVLKCMVSLVSIEDNKLEVEKLSSDLKENLSQRVIDFLMNGNNASQDEFLYCKAVIVALRVLYQLYFIDQNVRAPLPEVIGISRHFILYGLVKQGSKPEKIMPAHQTVAMPHKLAAHDHKGGKKQRVRRQKNRAFESIKKEITVSGRTLMRDVDNYENKSAYKPASSNYLDLPKLKNVCALSYDSDMSDVENTIEAKLIALKSCVRQGASSLLLVVVKTREKRDIFGYWWALLPDAPDPDKWLSEESSKTTLMYCAVSDPIASCRASALSAMLALLSGPRVYLAQAECSHKENTSFIPYSVSLGHIIICLHKVLTTILDSECSYSVIIVALKCCAALIQATPYHKMKEGLISEMVKSTRKFLVHRDSRLQVGALITMGCVLSVHPKTNEVLESVEKDAATSKVTTDIQKIEGDCDDFEEGYSDDEMFTAEYSSSNDEDKNKQTHYFKSWVLDICFKNIGWMFKDNEVLVCKQSEVSIIYESLKVLSAIAYHHFSPLLLPHMTFLADVLGTMLRNEHQDVIMHSASTVSFIGDAILKLEKTNEAPPQRQCVSFWEKLLTPLSAVLQSHENTPARAVVCDCIANIGDNSFRYLQRHQQVLCCTLLVGSSSDDEAAVRAAAVRALAMIVMYRTLREDIGFVSDCGENILRAIAEPSQVVRSKAAWALGNLTEVLVLNMLDPETDEIDDSLLHRLLVVSVQSAGDNDKVKTSATRALGNLLRLIKNKHLQLDKEIKTICETAIEKLLECACKGSNMKVRWNACHALGNVMKNDKLFTGLHGWQRQVFLNLCSLTQECKNIKVRINAAVALRAPNTREQYGDNLVMIWRSVMEAIENGKTIEDFTEYQHMDNLVEQLCVTLAHMCCLLNQADLPDILDPLVFYYDSAKGLFTQLFHRLPPESASIMMILQAAKYVTVELTASNDKQQQALALLQDILIWEI